MSEGKPDRRFMVIMGATVLIGGGIGIATCAATSGSGVVAEKWVADIRGNHLDEAMPIVSSELHLDDPEPRAALERIKNGKGEVSSGVRGFGHNGEWVPYTCQTVDARVWIVLMKREGKWKIVELHTSQSEACDSD